MLTKIIKWLRKYWRIMILFAFSLLFNILIWTWLYLFIRPIGESVALHYNIYFGIDRIGRGANLYLQPLIGTVVWIINFIAAVFLIKTNHKRIAWYLCGLTLVLQLSLAISLIALVINYY